MQSAPLPYLLLSTLLFSACASHYEVRDPASGNRYYTRDVDRSGDAGAVKFKDESTGAQVTIPQSEVRPVSGDEYDAGIRKAR